MRYGVHISNNLREPKNLHGPRNVLECFPLSFLCSETVSLQAAHSQMYSQQQTTYFPANTCCYDKGKNYNTFNEMSFIDSRPFL
jgi:hypothetical protein